MSRYQRSMRSALQSVADSQIEFDEAVKWEVKISGLPTFYADGKSKGEVKMMLRKLLKRPDEIVSIERTTPAELKKIRRGQAAGVDPDEDVKEEILLEDNRVIKVQNKELTIDDIVNMIQFGKPFTVGEDIPATLPPGDSNFPRYKDIPNSLVDKEDKKANKVKAKAEKDTLVPTETQEALDTWHPDPEKDKKSTSYKHHVKITSGRPKAKKTDRFGHIKVTADQLKKESNARQSEAAQSWLNELQITQKGLDALRAARDKPKEKSTMLRITKKGREALEKDKKNQNKDPVGKQHEGVDEAHPDAGVPLSARRARKKKSAAQMRADMKHADHLIKLDKGERRRKEQDIRQEETEVKTSRTVMGGQEYEVIEVAPPGWGHTKAEKEKTKPNKPKSKIGGSAHEFDKDLKSGKFKGLPGDKTMKDKRASMFKLMWSMKNKGDKPHYKPGVKDKLKAKYKKEENLLDTTKRYLSE